MQALTRNSDLFAAGVANAPVVNWVTTRRFESGWSFVPSGGPFSLVPPQITTEFRAIHTGPGADLASDAWFDHTQANLKLAWDSSPSSNLDNISSPLLLIQGDADESVAFQETIGGMILFLLLLLLLLLVPHGSYCRLIFFSSFSTPSPLFTDTTLFFFTVARSLRRRGFPTEKLGWFVVPGECHGMCKYGNQVIAANKTAEWLDYWLNAPTLSASPSSNDTPDDGMVVVVLVAVGVSVLFGAIVAMFIINKNRNARRSGSDGGDVFTEI